MDFSVARGLEVKRLLMIAFHFPPAAGSSGIQRTLRFARHLPSLGWEPMILTASPCAYERTSDDQLGEAQGILVGRAFAMDAARHLCVLGRYPGWAARPDRWISWWLGAVPKGLEMIRKYRPAAIWSTYPIATAHKIACTLQQLSGLPWIADFRDPMAQDGYPEDPATWKSFKRIEEATLRRCSRAVFVTEGAARMYRERYPELPPGRIRVVENGYDEESFAGLETPEAGAGPLVPGRVTLLHSGAIYPGERDPTKLFAALARLAKERPGTAQTLRVRLRAPGHEALLRKLIDAAGVASMVELAPPLPYRAALQEMLSTEGLLVLQASNCNDQVPAKLYEYLRSGRPIVGLTDPAGETAALLRRAGVDAIARLDSEDEIASVLRRFLDQAARGALELPDAAFGRSGSRLERTAQFAHLLDECAGAAPH
jgi:glycosyltransferase involved in cell wall biosynthesis